MDSSTVYKELMTIAEKVGYLTREENVKDDISTSGGKYIYKKTKFIMLNIAAPLESRIELLVKILTAEDLSKIHIPPFIREKYFENE